MTKIGNFLSLILIFLFPLFAQSAVTVQSTVDRNEMGLGDTFTLVISVLSNESVSVQEPRVPQLDGFDLVNKWDATSVAQKMVSTPSGMNWQTQRKKDFNYMLSPKQSGRLSVDAFEVIVDGKVYRTQPIVIHVDNQPNRPKNLGKGQNQKRPRPNQDDEDSVPGFGMPGMNMDDVDRADEELLEMLKRNMGRGAKEAPQYRTLPINPNEAFFIQVEADKTEVYEGEQITVSWYVYTRGQMETLDRVKFPDLRGFWKEVIEEVPSIQFTEEIVNGVPYRKALLATHALFPIKAGTSVIDEYKIKSRVRLPLQGMGGFGIGKAYEYTKSSQRVSVKVKPLPTEGRPQSFTGAVGQFDLHSSVEGQSFPVNQPFSVKVRFEGAGNAKGIELPAIEWPKGLEIYDTKSESKFFKNGRSYKEFEVLVIPRQEGDLTIPAMTVSMFDPSTHKYYTRTTQALQIKVVNNPNAPVGSANRINPKEANASSAKVIRDNVLPDLLLSWEASKSNIVTEKPIFWILIYGLICVVLLWKARQEFGWGKRKQNLRDLVRKRYKKLDLALKNNDYRKVGAEMTNIMYLLLGEVSGSQGRANEEFAKVLEKVPPSIRRDFGQDLEKKVEVFQILSFAPVEALGTLKDSERLLKEVSDTKKLIDAVISSLDVEKVET